jgi:hypothetical protein
MTLLGRDRMWGVPSHHNGLKHAQSRTARPVRCRLAVWPRLMRADREGSVRLCRLAASDDKRVGAAGMLIRKHQADRQGIDTFPDLLRGLQQIYGIAAGHPDQPDRSTCARKLLAEALAARRAKSADAPVAG